MLTILMLTLWMSENNKFILIKMKFFKNKKIKHINKLYMLSDLIQKMLKN